MANICNVRPNGMGRLNDRIQIIGIKLVTGGGKYMSPNMQILMNHYIVEIKKIYGSHLKRIILYGSYARGDYRKDSDVDIMILLDISDMAIKEYRHQLSDVTYGFNMEYELDIKPIVKNETHFRKWVENYPFYANVNREGVTLFGAA